MVLKIYKKSDGHQPRKEYRNRHLFQFFLVRHYRSSASLFTVIAKDIGCGVDFVAVNMSKYLLRYRKR